MSMQWMTIYYNLKYAFDTFDADETVNGCVSMFIPKNDYSYNQGVFKFNSTYDQMGWNRVIDWKRYGW